VILVLEPDVRLRLNDGESVGWVVATITRERFLPRKEDTFAKRFLYNRRMPPILVEVELRSAPGTERFSAFTAPVKFQLTEALFARTPAPKPLIGVDSRRQAAGEMMSARPAGWPPREGVYGRIRYAGLWKRVVYAFEELPVPP
jgi:hypothetical protein